MILYMHSNASYLPEPHARIRDRGDYFLIDRHPDMTKPPSSHPQLNGPIHSISCIMTNVMGLSVEAKIGSTYTNEQEAVTICILLLELLFPCRDNSSPLNGAA